MMRLSIHSRRSGRRAFTMAELLMAASVSAMTAAAATALVFAVSNATTQTRDVRTTTNAGNYALARIATTIREAHGIGQVTPTTVTLWLTDTNGDDTLNLYETGVIRYDATAKQILFDSMQPPTSGTPTTTVSALAFKDAPTLSTRMAGPDIRTIVWADNVQSLTFRGYPDYTDVRVVETSFTLGTGQNETQFETSESPRASADYLFSSNALGNPLPGSTRKTRKLASAWRGISTLTQVTATVGWY